MEPKHNPFHEWRNKLKVYTPQESPIPSSIIPDEIYISGMLGAKNIDILSKLQITHIINCGAVPKKLVELGLFESTGPEYYKNHNFPVAYKEYMMKDSEDYDMSQHFEETSEFIDQCIKNGGRVLVHCMAGVSRSSTVIAAYLIMKRKWTIEKVAKLMVKSHWRTNPNDTFVSQLVELEKKVKSQTKDSQQTKQNGQLEQK